MIFNYLIYENAGARSHKNLFFYETGPGILNHDIMTRNLYDFALDWLFLLFKIQIDKKMFEVARNKANNHCHTKLINSIPLITLKSGLF